MDGRWSSKVRTMSAKVGKDSRIGIHDGSHAQDAKSKKRASRVRTRCGGSEQLWDFAS